MMDAAALTSLFLFALAMSITPGPNNLTVATSGLAFGMRGTVPVLVGTVLGFLVLMILGGLGVAAIVAGEPRLQVLLQGLGVAYLLYLSLKLWRSAELRDVSLGRPLSVWHGATLQLVNPKAWMMAVGAIALFVASSTAFWPRLAVVTLVLLVVSVPCMLVWTAFGAGMRSTLRRPGAMLAFMRGMSLLTALSALMMVQ